MGWALSKPYHWRHGGAHAVKVRLQSPQRDRGVSNLNPWEGCTGPSFCPSRVKSSHFSSGCVVLHALQRHSQFSVSGMAFKGNKAFCIINPWDSAAHTLPMNPKQTHNISQSPHSTAKYDYRLQWGRFPSVSDIAVPQCNSQVAWLHAAGRRASYNSLKSKRWISTNILPSPIKMFLFTQFRRQHQQYLFINTVTFSISNHIT